MSEASGYRYRSLFWPVMLVGVGVVWLLVNLGVVSGAGLAGVAQLWPLLLVGIGLDLLFGHRSPLLGGLMGALTVGIAVVLILLAPAFGWAKGGEVQSGRFREPVGTAATASVRLDLSSAETRVYALSDSPDLVDADLRYRGEIEFLVQESTGALGPLKTVSLRQKSTPAGWFTWIGSSEQESWSIGLSPSLPLDLSVEGGSGSATLKLEGLELTAFRLDVGSGSVDIQLPASSGRYAATLESGSGSARLSMAAGASVSLGVDVGSGSVVLAQGDDSDLEATVRGGSGSLRVEVPAGQGLRVEVRDSGSGSVRLPSGLTELERGEGDRGVWESPGYGAAAHKTLLVVEDMGSGSLEVRTVR